MYKLFFRYPFPALLTCCALFVAALIGLQFDLSRPARLLLALVAVGVWVVLLLPCVLLFTNQLPNNGK